MDLFTSLRSNKAKFDSWKQIYENIVHKLKYQKDNENANNKTNWYEKCMNKEIKNIILPKLTSRKGTKLIFNVTNINDDIFDEYIERYVRMIIMATLYNVTCDSKEQIYVSNYDHDTDMVTSYPIQELLMAAFYGIEIRGILFINQLSKDVLKTGYSEIIQDSDNIQIFNELNYQELFNLPFDGDNDNDNDIECKNIKKLNKNELYQYPCCKYKMNLKGYSEMKCTTETCEGAHHCFGCGTESMGYKYVNHVSIHQQMFDFNNFIVNMEKIEKKDDDDEKLHSTYNVQFDQNQNPPYKHASYSDMGRSEVITSVKKSVSDSYWVTNMNIKIFKMKNSYKFYVTHVGIDWF